MTATDSPGPHNFSGTITDENKDSRPVGGPTRVTITAPATPSPTAVRSISPSSVEPGGQFTVTIRANNYGRLARVIETLDSGLTTTDSDAVGQTVTKRILQEGPQTVSYTVTAPDTTGEYNISRYLGRRAEDGAYGHRQGQRDGEGTPLRRLLRPRPLLLTGRGWCL